MKSKCKIAAGMPMHHVAGMLSLALVLIGPALAMAQQTAPLRPQSLPNVAKQGNRVTFHPIVSSDYHTETPSGLVSNLSAMPESDQLAPQPGDVTYSQIPATPLLPSMRSVAPVQGLPYGQMHVAYAEPRCGFQCDDPPPCGVCHPWKYMEMIPWEIFAQGEYIGPARLPHVPQYRLRVDDRIDFVYRLTQQPSLRPYELEVGDQLRIESLTTDDLNRDVIVQPDGTISLVLLNQVAVAGKTVEAIRVELERGYKKYVKLPSITVTPLTLNTRLEELRATVDNRAGIGGQSRETRVTPEGTVQLPAIGSVFVQGLSLDEAQREVEARYKQLVDGLQVTPILLARAPRYVYVVGEVPGGGRFTLEAPTTAMQAIALAGGWNVGANLNHVVVFRRDENWRLMATTLDLFGALYGNTPCPADEIWLRDSDIVVVPKRKIKVANDIIELFFTRGVQAILPTSSGFDWLRLTTL